MIVMISTIFKQVKRFQFKFQPDLDETDVENFEFETPQNTSLSDENQFRASVLFRSSPVPMTDQPANPDEIFKPKPVNLPNKENSLPKNMLEASNIDFKARPLFQNSSSFKRLVAK